MCQRSYLAEPSSTFGKTSRYASMTLFIRHPNLMVDPKIKAESIVASSFDEVLYLDSDNVPLADPAHLFDSELYAGKNQPGIVFWPDLNKDHRASCCSFLYMRHD